MANGDEQDEGKMGRAALVRRVIATEAGAALLAEIDRTVGFDARAMSRSISAARNTRLGNTPN